MRTARAKTLTMTSGTLVSGKSLQRSTKVCQRVIKKGLPASDEKSYMVSMNSVHVCNYISSLFFLYIHCNDYYKGFFLN